MLSRRIECRRKTEEMPKKQILRVNKKEVESTALSYDDLVILFQQYISEYGEPPTSDKCNGKYNLPCISRIKTIVGTVGGTYEEFLYQFGLKHGVIVNGILKSVNEISYEDLKYLYKEYIDQYHKAPTTVECKLENNLPYKSVINLILEQENITHDEFLLEFGYMNNKRKYPFVHIGDIFGRWKVISKADPRKGGHTPMIPYWLCECTCGSKTRREISENALQTGNSKSCGCLQIESIKKLRGTYRKQNFEEWCAENKHQEFLERWDYAKNTKLPSEVSYVSSSKFYFKCPIGKHESSLYALKCVIKMKILKCRFCDSFAQRFIDIRGEDAVEKYWDFEKKQGQPVVVASVFY